jgi:hypothetical protein
MMKDVEPEAEGLLRRAAGHRRAGEDAERQPAIDFIIRREFDYQIVDYANGKPIEEIPGASFRKDGVDRQQSRSAVIENLDALPWVTKTTSAISISRATTFRFC